MANELPVITYGGQSLSEYGPLVGRYNYETDGREAKFMQDFLVIATSGAAFVAACQDIENSLNSANKALALTWENVAHISHDPAANTGLLCRGRVLKRGDDNYDQQRSRRYTFVFTCLLPASAWRDDASELGYFDTQVTMACDATGRPTFQFVGEYRAEKNIAASAKKAITLYTAATNGAKARALAWLGANATTFAGSVFAADHATAATNYELIEETAPVDSQDPGTVDLGNVIAGYRLVYRFRMIPENASGTAEAGIVVESMSITLMREKRIGNLPLQVVTVLGKNGVEFVQASPSSVPLSFRVDADIALKYGTLDYTTLRPYYDSTLRDFLKAHLQATWVPPAGSGEWVMRSESVPVRTDANRVSVSWVIDVPNARSFLNLEYTVEYGTDWRRTFLKLGTGDNDQFDEFSPSRVRTAIQKASGTILTPVTDPVALDLLVPRLSGVWRSTGRDIVAVSPMSVTNADGATVQLIDFAIQRAYQLNTKAPSVGGGAAPGIQLTR